MINKDIDTLCGPNGGGKSSLIYALLFMLEIKDEDLGNKLRPEDNVAIEISFTFPNNSRRDSRENSLTVSLLLTPLKTSTTTVGFL